MSNVLHIFGAKGLAVGASNTSYIPCFTSSNVLGDSKQSTEDYVAVEVQNGGTISNVCVYISANNRAASTLRVRVNGANGNTAITITGSTTGQFEDSSNTDSADDAEELNYSLVTGAGGTTFAYNGISHLFAPTSGTYTIFGAAGRTDLSGTADSYQSFAEKGYETTENRMQYTPGVAGTLDNLAYYVTGGNTRSDSTSIRSRINSANGNLICTYAAGATGIVRDDSNTDSTSIGDEINLMWDQAGGTGAITNRAWSRIEFVATDTFLMGADNPLGTTIAFGITRYVFVAGCMSVNTTATEADVEIKSNLAFIWSDLYSFVDTNSINATSTVRSRINRANGNMNYTYATTVTGQASDTTNTDSVADNDEIDISMTTGGSSGTIRLKNNSSIGYSATASSSIKTFIDLANASTKTVDDLANASTKTWAGYANT